MGRGPKDIHTHLLGDLLVVHLRGVLTAAEQHLVKSLPGEKGRDLLKRVRTHLVETARPLLWSASKYPYPTLVKRHVSSIPTMRSLLPHFLVAQYLRMRVPDGIVRSVSFVYATPAAGRA